MENTTESTIYGYERSKDHLENQKPTIFWIFMVVSGTGVEQLMGR